MKLILYLFITLIFGKGFSQKAEQIALNFYAEKYAEEDKDSRIRYDGKITNYGNEFAKNVVLDFYDCKINYELRNKIDGMAYEEYNSVDEKLTNINLKFETVSDDLKIPKELIFRKKLRESSVYRNFINYNLNKFWYWIFPEKYNVIVYPSVKFSNFTLVEIHADKKDREFGRLFYVKLGEDLKIIDSCESGWIQ